MSEEGRVSEESNETSQKSGLQKIRLFRRRGKPSPEVKENLKALAQNKKLMAQERYYGSHNANPFTPNKPPVHQRLGLNRKKVNPYINTSNLMPGAGQRLKLIRSRSMFKRKYSAQNRIYQIRQNQQFNRNNMQKIKLFRRPTNLVVQVDNSNFRKPLFNVPPQTHSVPGSLNPQTQSEIRMLQNQCIPSKENILPQPIHLTGIGATAIYINDRFSKLP